MNQTGELNGFQSPEGLENVSGYVSSLVGIVQALLSLSSVSFSLRARFSEIVFSI